LVERVVSGQKSLKSLGVQNRFHFALMLIPSVQSAPLRVLFNQVPVPVFHAHKASPCESQFICPACDPLNLRDKICWENPITLTSLLGPAQNIQTS
jgi:hypothetical protein